MKTINVFTKPMEKEMGKYSCLFGERGRVVEEWEKFTTDSRDEAIKFCKTYHDMTNIGDSVVERYIYAVEISDNGEYSEPIILVNFDKNGNPM